VPSKKWLTSIAVAIIGAIPLILGSYWQFVYKPGHSGGAENEPVVFTGQVLAAETKSFVADAPVTLVLENGAKAEQYTDSNGNFSIRLDRVKRGTQGKLYVHAGRYQVFEENLVFDRPTFHQELRLQPAGQRFVGGGPKQTVNAANAPNAPPRQQDAKQEEKKPQEKEESSKKAKPKAKVEQHSQGGKSPNISQQSAGANSPNVVTLGDNSPATVTINPEVNPNAAVTTYDFNGVKHIQERNNSTAVVGDEMGVFQKISELQQNKDWIHLRDLCEESIHKYPQWLTPYLFSGVAFANLGDKKKAIERLEYVHQKAGGREDYKDAERLLAQLRQ